jgi:hypothetical protein
MLAASAISDYCTRQRVQNCEDRLRAVNRRQNFTGSREEFLTMRDRLLAIINEEFELPE